jgi:hypothetical protein
MALPAVDFAGITATAQEALALYGTSVTFTEQGAPSGRQVRTVAYRQTGPVSLLQDLGSEPANALLSPADFIAPNRLPQQFDTLTVDVGGFKRIYSIEQIHPVAAQDYLALITATIRGN